ncbi:serine-threonine protein kinase [Streptosporangium nondiastaticum]|uniref:Serine-threonine protein kinase n=2 Tax=Streptosporangium nondiastaticum TaxID=35764 RepID=A0A9X7JN80_9ACTN|nr:serine-threonine protein kinase [Streptosporangium nondiastaticum]
MSGMSAEPYWELTFDADGDADTGERDALIRGAVSEGLTDLVVFAHGWNNDRPMATALYSRFYAPFPGLVARAPGVRLGYAGVIWPSMRFPGEAVPDFPSAVPEAPPAPPVLDAATREALIRILPCERAVLDRLAELAAEQPEDPARLEEFVSLVRGLAPAPPQGLAAADAGEDDASYLLTGDALRVCESFAGALDRMGALPPAFLGGGLKRLWGGALEVLRQMSYYTMKRRAGIVGEKGLGPALALLAESATGLRVHLAGHSFGARLVSFALRGLPDGGTALGSVTLLQGAFSHYAFSSSLPFDTGRGGALDGLYRRIRGPLVACHSSHDSALGTLYPLASMVSREDDELLGLGDGRWGAVGHDGIRAVDPCARIALDEALRGALPAEGCVSVDASSVVARGGPPSGAHSDICHEELARVILHAGRVLPAGP